DVAAVDRLAEDRRLPHRERLEPAEPLAAAAGALLVAVDELGARGEARLRGRGGRAERRLATAGLGVRGDEVADIRARVADRAHLPVEHGGDTRRVIGDQRVSDAVVAMDDRVRERL